MSRSLLVTSVISKAAWLATLAIDHVDSAFVGGSLVMGIIGLLPSAYHLLDKMLDRMMRLPEVIEPEPVRARQ